MAPACAGVSGGSVVGGLSVGLFMVRGVVEVSGEAHCG